MTLDTLMTILRAALSLIGTYALGHNLLGHTIDASLWQEIAGAVLTVGSTVWGIVDKPTSIEGLQSAIRSVLPAVGGLLLALGITNQQTLDSIAAIVLAIIPVLQNHTSKVKVQQLDSGKIKTDASGKTQPVIPPAK